MSLVDWVAIIAICMIVVAAAILAVAVVLVVLGVRAKKAIDTVTDKAQPLISQATETVRTATSIAQSVKSHTEGIMNKAEGTVEDVSRKVMVTTNIVNETVRPPIITVASVLTGISKGLEVMSQVRRRGGNGREH